MICKYSKKCRYYNPDSRVCNETGGMYYADGTQPAGCFRTMEELDESN